MKPETVIKNGDHLKQIMAREMKLAGEKRSSKTIYRASVNRTNHLIVEAKARSVSFFIDEPASCGGADKGPNPEEALRAALGACQAITAALYAAFLELSIKRYEIARKGYADLAGFYGVSEKPTGCERVVCEITLESDSPAEKLREFERLVEERCVVHMGRPGPIMQPSGHAEVTGVHRTDRYRPRALWKKERQSKTSSPGAPVAEPARL